MRFRNDRSGRLLASSILTVAASLVVSVCPAAAAESDPVASFGVNGVATVPPLPSGNAANTDVRAVVAAGDGGLIVGGASGNGMTGSHGYLRRLDSSGAVDVSFGTAGATDLGDGLAPSALALLRDGHIVVGLGSGVLVVSPDGRSVVFALLGSTVERLVELPDGRVAVFSQGGSVPGIVHLVNPDGTVDSSFVGPDPAPSTSPALVDGGLLPDGRLVALKNTFSPGVGADCRIAVYTPTGSLDGSFGSGGSVQVGDPAGPVGSCSMAVEPTGSILVLRFAGLTLHLFRLSLAGSLTPVTIDPAIPPAVFFGIGRFSVMVDGLGRILLATPARVYVLRADGSIDPAVPAGLLSVGSYLSNGLDGGLISFGGDKVERLVGFGSVAPQPPVKSTARFEPLTPKRLLDTRDGTGAPAAVVGDGASIDVQASGHAGIPDGVVAVVLNLAATDTAGPGFVTGWPTGTARPTTANLNIERAGQTVSGSATIAVDASGRFSLFTLRAADLVADVAGYYVAATTSTSGRYVAAHTPTRLLDTRDTNTALAPGSSLTLQITGHAPVPAGGVSGVVLNLAATNTRADGYFTVWPSGTTQPVAASLNVTRGETRSNLVIVPVGPDGSVSIYSQSGADVIVDVAGWFTDSTAPTSSSGLFVPIIPSRILDTRYGDAPRPAADTVVTIGLAGGPRVPPSTTASAVLVNITAVTTTAPGYFSAWPSGLARPTVANLNATTAGQVVPNGAVVGLNNNGIDLYTQTGGHLVTDLFGYFLT